jgi:hypothetical protein
MANWKMQIHPSSQDGQACEYAIEALSDGLIGLDFRFDDDEGDLRLKTKEQIKDTTRRFYYAFCDEMKVGDHVLIVSHNYPFALCRVSSEYHYVTHAEVLGHWFRHFRYVEVLAYYRDYIVNPKEWPMIRTPNAISPMRDQDTVEYQLVEQWLADSDA